MGHFIKMIVTALNPREAIIVTFNILVFGFYDYSYKLYAYERGLLSHVHKLHNYIFKIV